MLNIFLSQYWLAHLFFLSCTHDKDKKAAEVLHLDSYPLYVLQFSLNSSLTTCMLSSFDGPRFYNLILCIF